MPSPDRLPPPRLPLPPVVLMMLVFGTCGFGLATWFARLPQVKEDLGVSEGVLGLALFGLPLGSVLAMPIAAIMIARIGAGPATAIATIAMGFVLIGPGLALSPWMLLMAMVVLGFANGLQDISMNAATSAIEKRQRLAIMNRAHAGFSLGGLLGAGLGALTAGIGVPVSINLLIVSGLILFVALCLWRSVWESAPDRATGPIFAIPPAALLGLAAMAFAGFFAEGGIADWSAVWLADGLGASPGIAPLGFAAFSTTMVIGRLSGDRLGQWIGDRWLLVSGGTVGGGAVLIGGVIGTPVAAILSLGVAGFGFATIVPILFRRAGATPGMSPGLAIAAVASVGYAGYLTSPAAIGLAAETLGMRSGFLLVSGFALTVALAALVIGLPKSRLAADQES